MEKYYISMASEQSIHFYESELYPFQDKICSLIQNDRFYLSGGTCLSRFYYQHRYSDDLDFFYDGVIGSKEGFHIESREIIQRISKIYRTEIEIDREYFKRIFAYCETTTLKIEFIYENFKNMGVRPKINSIVLDAKENLATNKLCAAYDRKATKDFIDLFYLFQEFTFEQAVVWSKEKMSPIDYEGLAIIFSDSKLEGSVLLKRKINSVAFQSFVADLINRMFDYAKNPR